MSTTKIGIGSLLGQGRTGSVDLPAEITLACPQCGTEVADKGNCLLEIAKVYDPSVKSGFRAVLRVDCRVCDCQGKQPMVICT